MKHLHLFFLILSLLLPASRLTAQDPEAIKHYRRGYNLIKSQNYRNAAIELEMATSTDTTYGDAFYTLGKVYKVLGEFDKAASAFEAAMRVGVSQQKSRDILPAQLADSHYKAALRAFKDARERSQEHKYREAIAACERALKYNPDNAKVHYIMGLCYSSMRNPDLEAAQKAHERAVKVDPGYVKSYKSLGDIHRYQRNFAPATKAYERAIALDSTYVEAYEGLARVQLQAGDLEAAVSLLRQALPINPEYADGYLLLGTALNRLGRQHEAVEPLRQAIELAPNNAENHFRLAEAYYGKGDYRQAIEAGRDATRYQKNYPFPKALIGDAHVKMGQLVEARTWYNRAIADIDDPPAGLDQNILKAYYSLKDHCKYQLEELDRQN